jgi:hypothetical protein
MQIQAVADRMVGMEVPYKLKQFNSPWRECMEALRDFRPAENRHIGTKVLFEVLGQRPDWGDILQQITQVEPGRRLEVLSLAELAQDLSDIAYEWDPWLPRGMLTVLGASQGVGKSFVALDMAYRVINGGRWPDDTPCERKGWPVVYVDAESVPQIINQRADTYGLDKSKLFLLETEPGQTIDLGMTEWQDKLIETVATAHPALVIIDSLSAVHSKGQNNVEDVRALLGFLTQLTASYDVATILIHHIRKPGGGVQMQMFDLDLSDLSGSSYITQVARVVWGLHVVQTGADPDPNGPREMRMLKNNLGPCAESLSFAFEPLHPKGVYLNWSLGAPDHYRPPTCEDWLAEFIKGAEEPVKPADVIEEGAEYGYSRSTIYRARTLLGAKVRDTAGSRKNPNNRWAWVR